MNTQERLDFAHVAEAGVIPDEFLQYTTVEYARNMLKEGRASLFDTAHEAGLSDSGRLHDLFVNIEGMTPGEYKNGGEKLSINYSFAETQFGNIIMAATSKGLCYMAFADDEQEAFGALRAIFPKAAYRQKTDAVQQKALSFFSQDRSDPGEVKCHLKGTDFRLKVWKTLLKIPMGQLTTYGDIAAQINNPGASRAVGSAVGDNPVSFLIPCHRVIRSSGELGGYHWGLARKAAIIGWEAAKKSRTVYIH
ncbi:MAG: methylated-DNA--[protein]-cysteine S-methyltransferase [Proteiniphilum sp.]|nr:methylated-DNA--[protein]-cysteine S-methyltransferase [Proteiniphilum sp.]